MLRKNTTLANSHVGSVGPTWNFGKPHEIIKVFFECFTPKNPQATFKIGSMNS